MSGLETDPYPKIINGWALISKPINLAFSSHFINFNVPTLGEVETLEANIF